MDRQLIQALIDALERSSLSELEYARDGELLRLVKGEAGPPRGSLKSEAGPPRGSLPAVPVAAEREVVAPKAAGAVISAPLYGVVHLRPAPDAEPFVAAGQVVVAGQVVCTVEAMKVFTEVRADREGRIEAVLVASGQEVEPGQALMRLA